MGKRPEEIVVIYPSLLLAAQLAHGFVQGRTGLSFP